jgi:hypothetical protein
MSKMLADAISPAFRMPGSLPARRAFSILPSVVLMDRVRRRLSALSAKGLSAAITTRQPRPMDLGPSHHRRRWNDPL